MKVFTSQSDSVSWTWSDIKSLTEVLSVKSFDPNVQWKKYVSVHYLCMLLICRNVAFVVNAKLCAQISDVRLDGKVICVAVLSCTLLRIWMCQT